MLKILINSKDRLKHILTETEYLKTVATRINTVEDLKNDEYIRRATEIKLAIVLFENQAKNYVRKIQNMSKNPNEFYNNMDDEEIDRYFHEHPDDEAAFIEYSSRQNWKTPP